jgi:N,N'-diacetyllegionaminate synthase
MKFKKTLIIAEIGPNHNGSLEKAKTMINKLSKLDCDFIKFQVGNPDNVYSRDAYKASYQKKYDNIKSIKKMSQKYHLSIHEHVELYKYCKKKKKNYLASFFDLESLKILDKKLNLKYIKVPSGELQSIDILKYLKFKKKKIILSTGMANLNEIYKSLKIIGKKNVTLLHCTSCYPAKDRQLNLRFINLLKEKFNLKVGYSDHSSDFLASILAVGLGAMVIEKHVTLNKLDEGPDHHMSLNIDEFSSFVKLIRRSEIILGSKNKKISNEEKQIKKVARKSIVSTKDLEVGHKIKKKDITFKRPGGGISPFEYKFIIGKKIKKRISKDKLIKKFNLV